MSVELVLDAHATIGESPTWVPEENALYWIDVKAPALHRLELSGLTTRRWSLPSDIGGFALTESAGAVVALRNGLFALQLSNGSLVKLADPPFDPQLHRFNETACDSHGRLWIGTMFDPIADTNRPAQKAGLFVYTRQTGLRPAPDEAELHNGMAWSPDESLFYLAHSNQRRIHVFDYDVARGTLGRMRPFTKISPDLGLPDGAAVDSEGGYWCAIHGGGRLRRYTAEGHLDEEVALPVSQPTMCAFAGAGLDTLYITTASDKLSAAQLQREPLAGGIFRYRPKLPGIPRPCRVA